MAQGLKLSVVPSLILTIESPLLPPSLLVFFWRISPEKEKLIYVPFLCGRCQGIASALVVNRLPRAPPNADECKICGRDCCGPDCCTEDMPPP